MSEWRADPVTGRWVVIAADEPLRRRDFDLDPVIPIDEAYCPLCEGEEVVAGREIHAVRNGTAPDGPGWRLRVVPNRVPALRVEGTLDHRREGPFERMSRPGRARGGDRDAAARCHLGDDARRRPGRACSPPGVTAWPTCGATRACAPALVFKNEGVKAGARLGAPALAGRDDAGGAARAGRGGGRGPPLLRYLRPLRLLCADRSGAGRRVAGGHDLRRHDRGGAVRRPAGRSRRGSSRACTMRGSSRLPTRCSPPSPPACSRCSRASSGGSSGRR